MRKFIGGNVPLSEHEQRQLEQIEQALYAEHPRLARAMRSADPRVHYRRRIIQAAIGFLAGVGLAVAGVLTKNVYMTAGGGALMIASGLLALVSYRRMSAVTSTAKRNRRKANKAAGTGMMERFEERWRRRQEEGR
jgi:hypothetical protein